MRCVSPLLLASVMAACAACDASAQPAQPVSPRRTLASLETRRTWLTERDAAIDRRDLAAAAGFNARLSADAIARAIAVHDAWMQRRNPATGLFPTSASNPTFTYRNAGADFLCFQRAIAQHADLPSLSMLQQSFAKEREYNRASPDPALPCTLDVATGSIVSTPVRERLFGASEYLKDGLIGLYERTRDPDVLDRAREIARGVIASSRIQSRFGMIPSRNAEINGNVLQALCVLRFVVPAAEQAEMDALIVRVTDAIIMQMFPVTDHLPVMHFDFPSSGDENVEAAQATAVQLRDHGNELAVGLSEAYALAVACAPSDPAWDERAKRWGTALARMYERLLEHGVRDDGLLMNRFHARTLKPVNGDPCDTWGYLCVGVLLYAQAAERHGNVDKTRLSALVQRVDRIALAVSQTHNLVWEPTRPPTPLGHHDGWADTVESAMYLAVHRPLLRETMLSWADREIENMFACQQPSGLVSSTYLDGNFIRTALLYAEARAGGFTCEKFDPRIAIGVACEPAAGETHQLHCVQTMLVREDASPCEPVHARDGATAFNLPWCWPRLNQWPAWDATIEAAHVVRTDE